MKKYAKENSLNQIWCISEPYYVLKAKLRFWYGKVLNLKSVKSLKTHLNPFFDRRFLN